MLSQKFYLNYRTFDRVMSKYRMVRFLRHRPCEVAIVAMETHTQSLIHRIEIGSWF